MRPRESIESIRARLQIVEAERDYIDAPINSPILNTLLRCDWLLAQFRRLPASRRIHAGTRGLMAAVHRIAESVIDEQRVEPPDVLALDHIQQTLEAWEAWEETAEDH